MKRVLTSILSAACLTAIAGAGPSFAFEREVNNVWWALFDNYNGSNQTACITENYNDHAVDAVFEVFPAVFDGDGNPLPSRTVVTLAPFQTYKIWGWPNEAGPGPRCELRASIVHVQ